MDKKNKKNVILLLVLLVIFIFTLVRALKPVKLKTITISSPDGKAEKINIQKGETSSSKQDRIFSFQEIDQSISKVQSLVKSIEEEHRVSSVSVSRDPFVKPGAKQISTGTRPSEYTSILVQEIPAPDFKISGIVYDKEKPMVILDDEIKAENEIKSGYLVQKILPDRVILKYKDKQFVLYVNSDSIENAGGSEVKLSDAIETGDTDIFITKANTYRSILKDSSANYQSSKKTEIIASQLAINQNNTTKNQAVAISDTIDRTQKILTVQVASFAGNKKTQAIEFAKTLLSEGYENVRVEKIKNMYTVRIGVASDTDTLIPLCENLKKYSETSFVRTAFYIQKRIVFPPQNDMNI
ncbi:MAG TPA: SPOR domain-containing protein [bacterium]|nr:SPOR domain-containing protein [bacterium]HPP07999.1 SPOR domain-containing protein [bacterium]